MPCNDRKTMFSVETTWCIGQSNLARQQINSWIKFKKILKNRNLCSGFLFWLKSLYVCFFNCCSIINYHIIIKVLMKSSNEWNITHFPFCCNHIEKYMASLSPCSIIISLFLHSCLLKEALQFSRSFQKLHSECLSFLII